MYIHIYAYVYMCIPVYMINAKKNEVIFTNIMKNACA